jgi:hypothetical protein
MTAGREIVRPHVAQPDHEVHTRVRAGDLHAIPEVLAQRADHRAARAAFRFPARRR